MADPPLYDTASEERDALDAVKVIMGNGAAGKSQTKNKIVLEVDVNTYLTALILTMAINCSPNQAWH